MKETAILEKKILSELKDLPATKISEVVDFIEYLKMRQNNWKERFRSFLKKVEPKMRKISYAQITAETAKVRNR